jgi:hypothetical protein
VIYREGGAARRLDEGNAEAEVLPGGPAVKAFRQARRLHGHRFVKFAVDYSFSFYPQPVPAAGFSLFGKRVRNAGDVIFRQAAAGIFGSALSSGFKTVGA